MSTQSEYLFVYGSLLSGFKSPAYEYIARYFNLVGTATVVGTIYDMGTFPVGTPHDTGRLIKGELYKIRNLKELSFAFAQLDDYEGMFVDEEEEYDNNYARALTEATLETGEKVTTWVYWYYKEAKDLPILDIDNMLDYPGIEGIPL
ncbi:hypothetical protein PIECOFPK_00290 [Mycovorax composti]|jgi:AIG2-like family.|uniref:Gamma-glutamylcyclotransferase AIG2-like domain-containing protein n=2 Tax=Chitinophagaceae TaxID=563835 RepID=A0ABZ2EGF9_9BACT